MNVGPTLNGDDKELQQIAISCVAALGLLSLTKDGDFCALLTFYLLLVVVTFVFHSRKIFRTL